RQLLAFGRKPPLRRQTLSMEELLRTTADFVSRSVRIPINLEIESGPDRQALVDADAGQLQQALVNLALNARDAQKDHRPLLFRLRFTTNI
ncbi:hypothetical protein ABTK17_19405, partial [Acinetobacter baumannii]